MPASAGSGSGPVAEIHLGRACRRLRIGVERHRRRRFRTSRRIRGASTTGASAAASSVSSAIGGTSPGWTGRAGAAGRYSDSMLVIFACRFCRRLIAISTVSWGCDCVARSSAAKAERYTFSRKARSSAFPFSSALRIAFSTGSNYGSSPLRRFASLMVSLSRTIKQRLAGRNARKLPWTGMDWSAGASGDRHPAVRRGAFERRVDQFLDVGGAAEGRIAVDARQQRIGKTPCVAPHRRAFQPSSSGSCRYPRPGRREASSPARRSRPSARPWCRAAKG